MSKTLKCVVVGDGTVGKTKLLIRYTSNQYNEEYITTVFDNYAKQEIVKGENVTLHLFDTAGQEDYSQLRTFCYNNVSVFVLCYAVNSHASFSNIKDIWVPEIRKISNAPIVLVATKVDVRHATDTRLITKAAGQKLRRDIKAYNFVECSAKEQINIETVFQEALYAALQEKSNGNCHVFRCACKLFRKK